MILKEKKELQNDINEMTAMLQSYVSFVKGEMPDPIKEIRKCSHQILGKTIRYDIFMTN